MTKSKLKELYEDVEGIWIDIVTEDEEAPHICFEHLQDVLERCRDLISHLMESKP